MIIGLVGFKGSGKDTFARTLIEEYGYRKDSFAAPLKDAVAAVFGWDRDMVEGATSESRKWREQKDEFWSKALGRDVTPRQVLQEMGTEVFRDSFDSNIWVDSFRARNEGQDNIVVTDVRFKNEMDTIKALGGKLFRIKRGEDPEWMDFLVNEVEKMGAINFVDQIKYSGYEGLPHASEWAWIEGNELISLTVNNSGTLDQLKDFVRGIAEASVVMHADG